MSLTATSQSIRFGLSQLAAKNGHHEFEHLCRHYSRARICSNILPATGPVAAGGDQGRDFETFRTYLTSNSPHTATFAGRAANVSIVFACTLQQDGLPTKIRSDLNTIVEYGLPVDQVVYFCEANMPVAARHKLQREAVDKHGVSLDIHDGQALAEQLAERDTIWIAQRYLDIPAEVLPSTESDGKEAQGWYARVKVKWRSTTYTPVSYGDFAQIKSCLRVAATDETLVSDLHWWMELMESFYASGTSVLLQRLATYELAVASLKGTGTLFGSEARLTRYFDGLQDVTDLGGLQDAQVMLMYCAGAKQRGLVDLDEGRLTSWRDALIRHLQAQRELTSNMARQCQLLETLAATHLVPQFGAGSGDSVRVDVDAAFGCWTELLAIAPGELLFPVEHLANFVTAAALLLVEHPSYRRLTQELDAIVAERSGLSAVAEKCRDRAMTFFEASRYVEALREFHQAKIDWFQGDTYRGALLAAMLIGQCYERLQLCCAAKYYYLAAASMAINSGSDDLDIASRGVLAAALTDYRQGAWFSFLELAEAGTELHAAVMEDPWDLEQHDEIEPLLLYQVIVLSFAASFVPDARPQVEAALKKTGTFELVRDLRKGDDPWLSRSVTSAAAEVQRQLGALPFSDGGKVRVLAWKALGLDWALEFDNSYEATQASERLAAVCQILIADLADADLCLLRTSIRVRVNLQTGAASPSENLHSLPSNEGRQWELFLTPFDSQSLKGKRAQLRELMVDEALPAVVTILDEVSLLPTDELMQRVEKAAEEGIFHKVAAAAVYDELYQCWVSPSRFGDSHRSEYAPLHAVEESGRVEAPELSWRAELGPGYSPQNAKEFLDNRYRHLLDGCRYTLIRLSASASFREATRALRARGLLDWHILGTVYSILVNYRANLATPRTRDELDAAFRKWLEGSELADSPPVPSARFTQEDMLLAHQGNLVASLKTWGLVAKQETPDLGAIEDFLRTRYRHYDDDIVHTNPFD